jgi:hypothetical protein
MAMLGGKVVLFGGSASGQGDALADTWVFDGTSWTQAMPAHVPPARFYPSMATLGAQVVLFGGSDVPASSRTRGRGTARTGRSTSSRSRPRARPR